MYELSDMSSIIKRMRNIFRSQANAEQTTASVKPQQSSVPQQQLQQAVPNGVVQQPLQTHDRAVAAPKTSAAASGQLTVQLQNQTNSNTVYAYISEYSHEPLIGPSDQVPSWASA